MANVTYQLNFPDKPVDPLRQHYPVAAETSIKKGWIVCLNSSKLAVPGADSAGYVYKGICMEDVDNTGGAAGDKHVEVFKGEVEMESIETEAQTTVDALRYVKSNHEIAATGNTTHNVKIGPVTRFVSSSKVFVDPLLKDPTAGA